MNVHELPMLLFTILAQMSVGAFIVLGVITIGARLSRRYGAAEVEELSDPAVLAVGGALVLGLGASMFHMNDVFHVFNVFRHLETSWLSREIVSGILFAASGFAYAACQIFRIGSPRLRQGLALLTAVLGVVLLVAMSMVYMSLSTVPAWHTWLTMARFFTTALLLGSFAVGTAFVTVAMLRRRGAFRGRLAARLGGGQLSPSGESLMFASLRAIAVAGIVLLLLQLVWYVLTLTHLMGLGQIGLRSAESYTGGVAIARFVLSILGAGLLGLFLFRLAAAAHVASADQVDPSAGRPTPGAGAAGLQHREWGRRERVAAVMTAAFVLVLASEFIARAAFYESMQRIGM
ncbi:dimethyl sulfoxide reductase anchor subunit family protein [Mobilicoccus massiliensis]|uniref:dimethyl sulfoxide reductase anchor subunit family protein n=1 Tax=Mobilicoccus massiliensis TaxID=1522310 RepID=UPI000693AEB0|nr:DmsC/YnfH family molybdoenzyme membrane anchor subunit [Mobilicoccus massiliensis]